MSEKLHSLREKGLESNPLLNGDRVIRFLSFCFSVHQVAWQDKHAFDDAKRQANHNHPTDQREKIAHPTRDEQDRQERCHGCEYAKNNGCEHLMSALNSSLPLRNSFLLPGKYALTYDDRVVNYDTEHKNKGEHGE